MKSPSTGARALACALIALAALLACWLRVHQLTTPGLHLDEIYGATYTGLGLVDTVVAVFRFDIHPPLYYLQLNSWAAVFGVSDTALLLNSVALSLFGWCVVTGVAWRRLGLSGAVLAGFLLAVSLTDILYAQEVRMYAFLSAICLTAWWLANRSAEVAGHHANFTRRELWLGLAASAVALTHGASFVPVSAIGLYWLLRTRQTNHFSWRKLCALSAFVAVPLVFVLANSAVRSLSHTSGFSADAVVTTLSNWLWGDAQALGMLSSWAWRWLATAVVLAAIVHGVWAGGWQRATALAMVAWPLALGAVLSAAVRPIWLDRTFAFCAPFALLLTASLLQSIGRVCAQRLKAGDSVERLAMGTVAILIGTVCVQSTLAVLDGPRKMGYREAAAFIANHAKGPVLVYAPDRPTFWGMARYLIGPDWGDALKVQDPFRSDKSTVWPKVYARLGPKWVAQLGLAPQSRSIEKNGRLMIIGPSADTRVREATELYLVEPATSDLSELQLPCQPRQSEEVPFRGVRVFVVSCTGRSATQP
ncbi:MAG: hypothetical protein ACK5QH_09095 [Rubrivivax sp.]